MTAGSELNEGLGRAEKGTPSRTRMVFGFAEKGRWEALEPRDTDGRTGSPMRVPPDGTTELTMPIARAKNGRCWLKGQWRWTVLAGMWRSHGSIVKRAARHGCEGAATTEVAHRLVRCSLTEKVNRPGRRQDFNGSEGPREIV